jgi:hypothetical protein
MYSPILAVDWLRSELAVVGPSLRFRRHARPRLSLGQGGGGGRSRLLRNGSPVTCEVTRCGKRDVSEKVFLSAHQKSASKSAARQMGAISRIVWALGVSEKARGVAILEATPEFFLRRKQRTSANNRAI